MIFAWHQLQLTSLGKLQKKANEDGSVSVPVENLRVEELYSFLKDREGKDPAFTKESIDTFKQNRHGQLYQSARDDLLKLCKDAKIAYVSSSELSSPDNIDGVTIIPVDGCGVGVQNGADNDKTAASYARDNDNAAMAFSITVSSAMTGTEAMATVARRCAQASPPFAVMAFCTSAKSAMTATTITTMIVPTIVKLPAVVMTSKKAMKDATTEIPSIQMPVPMPATLPHVGMASFAATLSIHKTPATKLVTKAQPTQIQWTNVEQTAPFPAAVMASKTQPRIAMMETPITLTHAPTIASFQIAAMA